MVCRCGAEPCQIARLRTGSRSRQCAVAASRQPGGRSRHARELSGWGLRTFELLTTTTVNRHGLPDARFRRRSTSTTSRRLHKTKDSVSLMMKTSKHFSCTSGHRTCTSMTVPPRRVFSRIKSMFLVIQMVLIRSFTTNVMYSRLQTYTFHKFCPPSYIPDWFYRFQNYFSDLLGLLAVCSNFCVFSFLFLCCMLS